MLFSAGFTRLFFFLTVCELFLYTTLYSLPVAVNVFSVDFVSHEDKKEDDMEYPLLNV